MRTLHYGPEQKKHSKKAILLFLTSWGVSERVSKQADRSRACEQSKQRGASERVVRADELMAQCPILTSGIIVH